MEIIVIKQQEGLSELIFRQLSYKNKIKVIYTTKDKGYRN